MAGAGSGLQGNFQAFAKFGDTKSTGQQINTKNFSKWLKEAKVIDGKKVQSTDVDIAFSKVLGKKTKGSKMLEFNDLEAALDEIAGHAAKTEAKKSGKPEDAVRKEMVEGMKRKLSGCNQPGTAGATKAAKSGAVDRLTDTSKYTGAHKERFDASGKGKGKEGREYIDDKSGYVTGYKEKDTYEKKTKK